MGKKKKTRKIKFKIPVYVNGKILKIDPFTFWAGLGLMLFLDTSPSEMLEVINKKESKKPQLKLIKGGKNE